MWFPLAQGVGETSLLETLAKSSISSVLIFAFVCTLIRAGTHHLYHKLPDYERHTVKAKAFRVIDGLSDSLVYAAIVVFMLVRPYFIQTFRIPTESMVGTLLVGDVLIVDKLTYRYSDPKFGDIVVFKPPLRALMPGWDPNTDYVKRLIGEPGQVVEIRDSALYIDGKRVEEPYVHEKVFGDFKLVNRGGELLPLMRGMVYGRYTLTNQHSPIEYQVSPEEAEELWKLPAEKIPPRHYLLIGDNRNYSNDGRAWGLVPRESVVGKAWIRIFPFNRMGRADSR